MPDVSVRPINDGGCISASLGGISTTATEAMAGSATLDGRRGIYIKNTSDVVLLWGFSGATCVFPLSKETAAGDGTGGEIWIDVGVHQQVFIKTASGSGKTAAIGELK